MHADRCNKYIIIPIIMLIIFFFFGCFPKSNSETPTDPETQDTIAPVITLLGEAVMNLTKGDTFSDPGVIAVDDVDGDITDQVIIGGDTVDTQTVATYVITYDVTDAAGNQAKEKTRIIQVSEIIQEPETPTDLEVTNVTSSSISMSWVDASDNETGFTIERSLDGIAFNEIITISANTTVFSDMGLDAETTYYYRVFAYNEAGQSDYSNIDAGTTSEGGDDPISAGGFIADHTVAKESVIRRIPESAIIAAKNNLHIMYCGTSHSSQVTNGMENLQFYKEGDDSLFAVTFDGNPVTGSLDIHYRPTSPVNVYSAYDLSHDSVDEYSYTDYYYRTIEYLDHPDFSDINVVMWSWCSISGHDVQRYIDNFDALIEMYRSGGSKGRTSENAVTFVWMTGYASGDDGDDPDASNSPYVNHKAIVDHCIDNNYFCLDYWSHDTHDYGTDEFYPFAQGNSPTHLLEWMNDHPGEWFTCNPAHAEDYDLLGNRRAYAAWWIWARIGGWDGTLE